MSGYDFPGVRFVLGELMALLSSGISQNVLYWLRMHQIKPYIKTLCFAASIFILDAVILNQGFVAVILILLALFVFFPFALLLRRRDRRKYEQRLVKIAIYVLTGVAVLGSNTLQIDWLRNLYRAWGAGFSQEALTAWNSTHLRETFRIVMWLL